MPGSCRHTSRSIRTTSSLLTQSFWDTQRLDTACKAHYSGAILDCPWPGSWAGGAGAQCCSLSEGGRGSVPLFRKQAEAVCTALAISNLSLFCDRHCHCHSLHGCQCQPGRTACLWLKFLTSSWRETNFHEQRKGLGVIERMVISLVGWASMVLTFLVAVTKYLPMSWGGRGILAHSL